MDSVIYLHTPPTVQSAEKMIKELANKGAISWTIHAKERMEERDIQIQEVINCLTKGTVMQSPYFSHEKGGGYIITMEKGTAGNWLRVVLCLRLTRNILIITAIN